MKNKKNPPFLLIQIVFSTFFRFFFRSNEQKSRNKTEFSSYSSLKKLLELFPHLKKYLESKFSITLSEEDLKLSLEKFSSSHNLPPGAVLLADFFIRNQPIPFQCVSPQALSAFQDLNPDAVLLDIRDHAFKKRGGLPGAQENTLEEIYLKGLPYTSEQPLLIYCQLGIKSIDVAYHLHQLGYKNISVLKGGFHAFEQFLDPQTGYCDYGCC